MEIRTIELEGTLVLHLNNHHIRITPLTNPQSNVIKLGIDAPSEVSVHREEIYKKKKLRGELNASPKNPIDPKKIQALFTELNRITCKSEKLELAAKELFERDKIIPPSVLEQFANGKKSTNRWIITCAIDVLLREHPQALKLIFSADELYLHWATPLLQRGIKKTTLLKKARCLNLPAFEEHLITFEETTLSPLFIEAQ